MKIYFLFSNSSVCRSPLSRLSIELRYQFISRCGEWMYNFTDVEFIFRIRRTAVFEGWLGWILVTFSLCKISLVLYYYTCTVAIIIERWSGWLEGGGIFVYPEPEHIFGFREVVLDTQYTFSIYSSFAAWPRSIFYSPRHHHHIVWQYVKMVSGSLCFPFITLLCKIAKFISFLLIFEAVMWTWGSKWMISIKTRNVLAKVDEAYFLVRYNFNSLTNYVTFLINSICNVEKQFFLFLLDL